MDSEKMGKYIAKLRKQKNMTQKELADKINVTDKAVSKWERGKGIPDIVNLEELAKVFGITIVELINSGKDNADADKNYADCEEEKRELALYKEEIEKYNMRRRKLHKSITIICVAVGIALITSGIYFLKNPYMQTSEAVRGSIDGPTAVYFVKKQPAVGSVISCITGIVCIAAGVALTVKDTRNTSKIR